MRLRASAAVVLTRLSLQLAVLRMTARAESSWDVEAPFTSVPNIMKVIGPLFLDDLDAEIHKAWDRAKELQQVLDRMSRIRVFDPACGSV